MSIEYEYHGRKTKGAFTLAYANEGETTVFLINLPDYSILLGSRKNTAWKDVDEAKQVFDKINKILNMLNCPDCGEPFPEEDLINLHWHCPKCGWD